MRLLPSKDSVVVTRCVGELRQDEVGSKPPARPCATYISLGMGLCITNIQIQRKLVIVRLLYRICPASSLSVPCPVSHLSGHTSRLGLVLSSYGHTSRSGPTYCPYPYCLDGHLSVCCAVRYVYRAQRAKGARSCPHVTVLLPAHTFLSSIVQSPFHSRLSTI